MWSKQIEGNNVISNNKRHLCNSLGRCYDFVFLFCVLCHNFTYNKQPRQRATKSHIMYQVYHITNSTFIYCDLDDGVARAFLSWHGTQYLYSNKYMKRKADPIIWPNKSIRCTYGRRKRRKTKGSCQSCTMVSQLRFINICCIGSMNPFFSRVHLYIHCILNIVPGTTCPVQHTKSSTRCYRPERNAHPFCPTSMTRYSQYNSGHTGGVQHSHGTRSRGVSRPHGRP